MSLAASEGLESHETARPAVRLGTDDIDVLQRVSSFTGSMGHQAGFNVSRFQRGRFQRFTVGGCGFRTAVIDRAVHRASPSASQMQALSSCALTEG